MQELEYFSGNNHLVLARDLGDFLGCSDTKARKLIGDYRQQVNCRKTWLKGRHNQPLMGYLSDDILYGLLSGWLNGTVSDEQLASLSCTDEVLSILPQAVNISEILSIDQDCAEFGEASVYFVPVLIAGKRGFIPNARNFLCKSDAEAWDKLPGYDMDDFEPEEEGYHLWFMVFMDAIGLWGQFFYPDDAVEGEVVKVITPVGHIWWVHGFPGLANYCQQHYMVWMMRAWAWQ